MMITISSRHSRNRRTAPLTEVRMVPLRPYNPVVPAQLLEADEQRFSAALAGRRPTVYCSPPASLAGVFCVEDQKGAMFLVE